MTPPHPKTSPTNTWDTSAYYLALTLFLFISLCPIWLTPYPAMHDYPNHLARAHVLSQYHTVPHYQETYELLWRPIPNLAMDLILPPLLSLISVETASKIFLSLTIALLTLGLHILGSTVNGRPHWSALIATYFTYNFAFSYGFVNYLFGMGLFFLALAAWLRWRGAWTLPRSLAMAGLLSLCYLAHLSSVVFLMICVGGITLMDIVRARTVSLQHLAGLWPIVPVLLLHAISNQGTTQTTEMIWWQPIVVKKAIGLLYPFLSYSLLIDLTVGLLFIAVMTLAYLIKVGRFFNREILICALLFLAVYFIAPMSGGVQSSYIDRRFLLPVLVLVVLAIRLDLSRAMGRLVLSGLLLLSLIRVGSVWTTWSAIGNEIQAQVRLLDRLPDGGRLYPMFVHDESDKATWLHDMHFFHIPLYATIYRHAIVPTLYAWKAANPLFPRKPDAGFQMVEKGTPVEKVGWDTIFSQYHHLWGYKLPDEFKSYLSARAHVLAEVGDGILYRLDRQPVSTDSMAEPLLD